MFKEKFVLTPFLIKIGFEGLLFFNLMNCFYSILLKNLKELNMKSQKRMNDNYF